MRFDSAAARLLNLFPAPNVPGTGFFNNNFISNGILNNDVDQFDIRVDHRIGSGSDSVFARYSFQNTTRVEPPVLEDPVASGDFSSDIVNRGQSAVAGWSRVFGATMFNELRGSFNKVRSDVMHLAFGQDVNAQYGIIGVPKDSRFYGGLPHIAVARVVGEAAAGPAGLRLGGGRLPLARPRRGGFRAPALGRHGCWGRTLVYPRRE